MKLVAEHLGKKCSYPTRAPGFVHIYILGESLTSINMP